MFIILNLISNYTPKIFRVNKLIIVALIAIMYRTLLNSEYFTYKFLAFANLHFVIATLIIIIPKYFLNKDNFESLKINVFPIICDCFLGMLLINGYVFLFK